MDRIPVRLLLLITEDWYFWPHRLELTRAARASGESVMVGNAGVDGLDVPDVA